MSYELRSATPGDAEPCARILREWIDETDWFNSSHPSSSDRRFLKGKIASSVVVVSSYVGHVAGFLVLDAGFVSCLYVAHLHRNRGVGKSLLDQVKLGRSDCLQLWTFQANTQARKFYEQEGFVAEEETDGSDNEEKLPDVRYVWSSKGSQI